ncbi:hypothetical protein ARMGADRAFT_609529 [Armillaria gallica]|uniref:Uncharacterized protein n=1 Tax=Armillaria gallica TaxID=47427 RepID=A0A2H3D100_ARMGA|nr:hypothetical protein ARMGADRAFT_609529 [Armillaria gallica]
MRSSTHTHPAPSPGRYWLLPAIPPIASQDPAATYHPGFDTPGADGLSSSLEGMLFRLPLSVLRRSAAFFISSTFTFVPNRKPIPINRTRCRPCTAIIPQACLSGLAVPPWRTFDHFEGVLSLAETWGWKGALSIVRASIAAPAFIRERLLVYALATRFVWEDEAEFASKHTSGPRCAH